MANRISQIELSPGLDMNKRFHVFGDTIAGMQIFIRVDPWSCGCQPHQETELLVDRLHEFTMSDVIRCLDENDYRPKCPVHNKLIGISPVWHVPGKYTLVFADEEGRTTRGKMADLSAGGLGQIRESITAAASNACVIGFVFGCIYIFASGCVAIGIKF